MAKTAKLKDQPVTTENQTEGSAAEKAETKSIVPRKYADRYKSGGSDELAEFIKAQCKGEGGQFSFESFFELCKKNGLPAEKVDHYAGQVAEKRHGSQGRARMTLRNMLATIARKNGKLVGLDGAEQEVNLPKPAVSGAAAKAKEDAAAKGAEGAGEGAGAY